MNYSSFLHRCEKKFPNEDCLSAIVARFQAVFSDGRYEDDSRIRDLFYVGDTVGKSQFYRMKNFVKEFYVWIYEQNCITADQVEAVNNISLEDIVAVEEVEKKYFRDLDDVLDFVGVVGGMYNLRDINDMLMIKSIVVLSWFGVEVSSMTNIRKIDVCYDTKTVIINERPHITIPDKYFDILHRQAVVDEYRGFPSGKKQVCIDSPYLMRTFRSAKMDRTMIAQAIRRFNSISSDLFDREISTTALKHNGVFERMRTLEDQRSAALTLALKEIAGKDRHAAFWYKTMYKKWREVYYPDEGGEI